MIGAKTRRGNIRTRKYLLHMFGATTAPARVEESREHIFGHGPIRPVPSGVRRSGRTPLQNPTRRTRPRTVSHRGGDPLGDAAARCALAACSPLHAHVLQHKVLLLGEARAAQEAIVRQCSQTRKEERRT